MYIIGHRGARGLAPENTVAAFKAGLEHGVDAIELDVRVTSDKQVVVWHDATIPDADGRLVLITSASLDELRLLKPDIATLSQGLTAVARAKPVHIEIKPGAELDPIIDCLNDHLQRGWSKEDIKLSSFDFTILREMSKALPTLELIVLEKWSGVRATHRARKLGTKQLAMNQRWLWVPFIRSIAHGGYQLSAYTVNDPKKAAIWARHGLYGIVTDYPNRFETIMKSDSSQEPHS